MPLLYLLYVLYGLVLLATPVLTISLFVRQARLRKQLNELAEENAKQLTKLQRAVGELQTKLAATTPPATPAPERASSPEARQPVPVPRSFPHVQIPLPVVVPPRVEVPLPSKPQPTPPILVTEKKPEFAAEENPLVPTPAVPVPP